MLQADGAVRHDHHRLAFDLGVAVRHGDRRFFVAAGEQLGVLVAAVVDEGFVQAAEAGAGIGGDVFEAERLDDVDHEVGAGAVGGVDVGARRRRAGFGGDLAGGGQRRGGAFLSDLRLGGGRFRDDGRGSGGGAF